jgi:hypothetical protein
VTDRDHFAAAALSGLMANPNNNDSTADTIRFWAWNWADAMLRERERTNHDAAPAARAPTDASPLRPDQGVTVGMGTGDTQGPVAWAVMLADNHRIWGVYALEEEANAINDVVAGGHGVAPLYRSPTLTDEEREAIEKAIGRELDAEWYGGPEPGRVVALRGLLERTK